MCDHSPTLVLIDYFVPFEVKKWVCLFTCLSVRATHLELTKACIGVVRMFITRRGQFQSIISGNGFFFGTARECKEVFKELCKEETAIRLAEEGIKWTCNPPAAPHLGGGGLGTSAEDKVGQGRNY